MAVALIAPRGRSWYYKEMMEAIAAGRIMHVRTGLTDRDWYRWKLRELHKSTRS